MFRISPELRGNDFEIDIIMCGVCISQQRFGNANEFRGQGQETTVGDMRRQRAAVGYKNNGWRQKTTHESGRRTEKDRCGQKRTGGDRIGQLRTEADYSGWVRTV